MSNNRGFKKICKDCEGCEDCKSFSRFRVSSCPQVPIVPQDVPEPPPVFTPVYGSLYGAAGVVGVDGTNVDFTTVGHSSGVTLNTVDDSITVNSSGVYTISFSTNVAATDFNQFCNVIFNLSINGTPDITKGIEYRSGTSNARAVNILSRTDQIMLNQGDVIRVSVIFAFNISYSNPALVVTKVA